MPDSETIDRLHEAMCVWKAGWAPKDLDQVRRDLQSVLDDLAPEHCCVCGKAEVGYHNYRDLPFCIPCANGGQAP